MEKFTEYNEIKKFLNEANDFNDIDKAQLLIQDFSERCDDKVLIKRLNYHHEVSVLKLCGTF